MTGGAPISGNLQVDVSKNFEGLGRQTVVQPCAISKYDAIPSPCNKQAPRTSDATYSWTHLWWNFAMWNKIIGDIVPYLFPISKSLKVTIEIEFLPPPRAPVRERKGLRQRVLRCPDSAVERLG